MDHVYIKRILIKEFSVNATADLMMLSELHLRKTPN